ncbi:MAG: hypothetical protein RR561_03995 [Peptostreptococcus sp.]|uniref:hypothetical protein n=1 Tax=Peptostreptococcus sp. TaxID=1262 RepID=UPI002FC5E30E
MNDIFKLYYYELVKNKRKFIMIAVFCLLFLLGNLYVIAYNGGNINLVESSKAFDLFINNPHLPKPFLNELKLYGNGQLKFQMDTSIVIILFGAAISILMSIDVVSRNYRKKHNSYYIEANLPVSIEKLKIARILCSLSLYIFYIILITISLLLANFISKMLVGSLYEAGLWELVTDLLIILPYSPKITLIITFIYVLTCIIGIQALTSIFYIEKSRGGIFRKLIYFILMITCGFLMIFYLFIIANGQESGFLILDKYNLLTIGSVVFVILSAALFTVDCKITKHRLRGGI